MAVYNLGSIGVEVHALVPNIPTALSGARLLAIADRKREFVENWTGISIGSQSIAVDYQDIVINLTAAATAQSMLLTGIDAGRVRLGDLDINPTEGGKNNLTTFAETFEKRAMEQLNNIGRNMRFYKAFG